MWVEEGTQSSYAAMLVFFPDFKPPPAEPLEVVRLLSYHLLGEMIVIAILFSCGFSSRFGRHNFRIDLPS